MTPSSAIRLLFALATLATLSVAEPVLNCTGSEYIADSSDLCAYYLCVNGEIHGGEAKKCAKGTRLPSWFNSSHANPCSKQVSDGCLRCDINDDPDRPDETESQCKQWQPCDPGCECHDVVSGFWCDCHATLVTLPPPVTPAHQCKDPSYCKNGGTCHQLFDESPFCNCPTEWTGKQCESKRCDWNPCGKHGTCVLNGTVVQCVCEECYRGSCCEILRIEDPDCINCSACAGGPNCTGGRPWLCRCNPCPDSDPFCSDGALNTIRKCSPSAPTAGSLFSLMFEENYGNESYSALELYITPGADHLQNVRQVTVSSPASANCQLNVNLTLTSGDVRKVPIPLCMRHNGTGFGRNGIMVKEVNNRTVTVFGINRSQFSADSFLALPDAFAGTHFVVVCYQSFAHPSPQNDHQSQIGIVATQDKTQVNITVAANVVVNNVAAANGTRLIFTIDAYQTFQIQANIQQEDLTGSIITASKPIHVVSGNVRTAVLDRTVNYTTYRLSSDNLVEEIPPATTWGKQFAIVPVPRTSLGYNFTQELIRIVASFDTICTVYNSTGERTFKISTNDDWFIEFFVDASDNHFLDCNSPVLIMDITLSADERLNQTFNDPSMIYIPSIVQYTNYYAFVPPVFSQTNKPYTYTFAILAAREGEYNKTQINNDFTINLKPFKPWAKIARTASLTSDRTALYGGIFPLPNGATSFIRHANKQVQFMCLIYAYDDRESIGHVGGSSLSVTNELNYTYGSQWLWALEQPPVYLNFTDGKGTS